MSKQQFAFYCACGKRIPLLSGTLEVHKKFCGKLRAERRRARSERRQR